MKLQIPKSMLNEWLTGLTGFGSTTCALAPASSSLQFNEFRIFVAARATGNAAAFATTGDQKLGQWAQTLIEERVWKGAKTFHIDNQDWKPRFAEEKLRPAKNFLAKYKSRITSEPDDSLSDLVEEIDELLLAQNVGDLEKAFAEENFSDYSNDIIVGVLSLTAVVKRSIPSWQLALDRAKAVLTNRKADVQRELVGL